MLTHGSKSAKNAEMHHKTSETLQREALASILLQEKFSNPYREGRGEKLKCRKFGSQIIPADQLDINQSNKNPMLHNVYGGSCFLVLKTK